MELLDYQWSKHPSLQPNQQFSRNDTTRSLFRESLHESIYADTSCPTRRRSEWRWDSSDPESDGVLPGTISRSDASLLSTNDGGEWCTIPTTIPYAVLAGVSAAQG